MRRGKLGDLRGVDLVSPSLGDPLVVAARLAGVPPEALDKLSGADIRAVSTIGYRVLESAVDRIGKATAGAVKLECPVSLGRASFEELKFRPGTAGDFRAAM